MERNLVSLKHFLSAKRFLSVRPEPVEGLRLLRLSSHTEPGFDKLSAHGFDAGAKA